MDDIKPPVSILDIRNERVSLRILQSLAKRYCEERGSEQTIWWLPESQKLAQQL